MKSFKYNFHYQMYYYLNLCKENTIGFTTYILKTFRLLTFLISITYSFTLQSEAIEKKTLKIEDAVKSVLDNNLTVKNAKLEIVKSDSAIVKNDSQFNWKIYGDVLTFKSVSPLNAANIISGTKISQDKIAIGVEKEFETGTDINIEVSTLRFDSNAFEGESALLFPGFSVLAIKPLYTGALSFKISQELWKHSFGKYNRNTKEILRLKSIIERDQLVLLLTNLVTKTLIDYWALSVQESAVLTYEKLLKNAKFIQDVTIRKNRLGTSENFEVNLWNSIVSNLKTQLEKSILERDIARRNLKRIMTLEPDVELVGVTELVTELPETLDFERDLEYALANRIDLKNMNRQSELSQFALANAEEDDNPSIKMSASYSSRGQTLISPQNNFFSYDQWYMMNSRNGVPSFKYPEMRAELSMNYPLWDEGLKENVRIQKVEMAQWKEKRESLKKEIENEIKNSIEAIKSSYETLNLAQKNKEDNEKYYKGISSKFSTGRYPAVTLKNALDSLAQSELVLVQSKVVFNINLVRYELVKNSLFSKYGIDPDKIVEEILAKGKESLN